LLPSHGNFAKHWDDEGARQFSNKEGETLTRKEMMRWTPEQVNRVYAEALRLLEHMVLVDGDSMIMAKKKSGLLKLLTCRKIYRDMNQNATYIKVRDEYIKRMRRGKRSFQAGSLENPTQTVVEYEPKRKRRDPKKDELPKMSPLFLKKQNDPIEKAKEEKEEQGFLLPLGKGGLVG